MISHTGFGLKDQIVEIEKLLAFIDQKEKKIKHPVNKWTGKPLSQKTIKQYERDLKYMKEYVQKLVNLFREIFNRQKSISQDVAVKMAEFTLKRRGETGKTFFKFVELGFYVAMDKAVASFARESTIL